MESNGEYYQETIENLTREGKAIIQAYRGQLKWGENEEILGIGCGLRNSQANIIIPVIPKSAKLIATDLSSEFVETSEEHKQMEFISLNIVSDNITDVVGYNRFSKVFSFNFLNWVMDQRKKVENIWKIMRPHGIAIVAIVSDSGMFHIYKHLAKQPKWRKYMVGHTAYLSPFHDIPNADDVYGELLEHFGFKVIECTIRPTAFTASSLPQLKKLVESINPFLNIIPKALHSDFTDDFVKCGFHMGWIKITQFEDENKIKYSIPFELIVSLFQKRTQSTTKLWHP